MWRLLAAEQLELQLCFPFCMYICANSKININSMMTNELYICKYQPTSVLVARLARQIV